MCLDSLVDFEIPDPGVGWKVFLIKDGCIASCTGIVFYPVWDEYYKAKEIWEEINSFPWVSYIGRFSNRYENGFHVFLSKNDAEKFTEYCCIAHPYRGAVVLPVHFRHVVATGYQHGKKVVVAEEMMILAEESQKDKGDKNA